MSRLSIVGIDDLDNIIYSYKNEFERYDKFNKCMLELVNKCLNRNHSVRYDLCIHEKLKNIYESPVDTLICISVDKSCFITNRNNRCIFLILNETL
jgi:hypothetical protein